MTDRYEYVPHPLLRRRVRDVASGIEGELMAVINEDVSTSLRPYWVELAYIRGPSGREFSTAVDNIEPTEPVPGPRVHPLAGDAGNPNTARDTCWITFAGPTTPAPAIPGSPDPSGIHADMDGHRLSRHLALFFPQTTRRRPP